jgi:RimJ/RimL family protein N-acetyltransferase
MGPADLDLVGSWLTEPHVARWFLVGSTIEAELDDLRRSIAGTQPTHALVVLEDGRALGWCQWYFCSAYPDHAAGVGAQVDDIGIDYAIGDPTRVGRGLGAEMIAALVAHLRERHPRSGLVADPEAANLASRMVLEKNGFGLLSERPVASDPTNATMAIYRLPPGV